jgi:hypothetical protein
MWTAVLVLLVLVCLLDRGSLYVERISVTNLKQKRIGGNQTITIETLK